MTGLCLIRRARGSVELGAHRVDRVVDQRVGLGIGHRLGGDVSGGGDGDAGGFVADLFDRSGFG